MTYGSGWRLSVEARVGSLHLNVELQGDAAPLAIVGPNGSGKTTLLRIIAGALTPARGTIVVGEETLLDTSRGVDLPPEARRVGYVPQGYGLFPHLTVVDNVAFGLSTGPNKRSPAARRAAAMGMLQALDCAHLASRRPQRLSGGEQQRVALARALLVEPKLLLLDEPLAALDVSTRRRVRVFLADRLRSLGRPAIVVTHDARDVAALDATTCVLQDGRVVQTGKLSELCAAPANEFVAEFCDAALTVAV
jgi:ABC-type sulfate/molybdate transport systems ATPase subunit